MADEDKSILIFVIGKETISGTKSASGAYKNPNAEVEIYNKNLAVDVPKGTSKIILKVPFEYEEASTKKDAPNFLFVLEKDGAEFARTSWSDKDVFYKFDSYSGELTIEIDLEKFYSDESEIDLNFSVHLECWLEESSWKPNAQTQKTASASGDAELEFTLPEVRFPGAGPEISLKILPTQSPGTDLKNVNVNADWGNPIFFDLWLDNETNNTINIGEFNLIEGGIKIKSANLQTPLQPKHKTIIVSEKGKTGAATWMLIKDQKEWVWYKKSGDKFEIKKKNQIYKYCANATQIIDEFGFSWKDPKTEEFLVNVRVPDYKIKAMHVYNDVFNAKNIADIIGISKDIAELGGGLGLGALLGLALKLSKWVNALTMIWAFEIDAGAWLISNEAQEVLTKIKNVMDDPPQLRRDYKVLAKLNNKHISIKKSASLREQFRHTNYLLTICKLTNDRYWSAALRQDKKYCSLQFAHLRLNKKALNKKFDFISELILKQALKIKNRRNTKITAQQTKELRKSKLTNKQIKILLSMHKKITTHKHRFAIALKKLSKSLKQFGDAYGR